MRRRVIVVFVIAIMCFGGRLASADERRLILSLDAGEKYNDNIFFSYEDEIDDYVTVLTGGLKFINRSERGDLSLSGRVVNQDYADNDELDGTDQFYSGLLGYRLTPHLRTTLNAAFSRDSQLDRDIGVTGLLLGTAIRESQKYGLNMEYDLTEITSTSLSYGYTTQEYDNPEFADYNYHQAGWGLTHRLDKYWNNTTGRLNINYGHYDYPTIGIDYYAGTIGFMHRLTEVWHLQVDVGARYTESEFHFLNLERTNSGWGGVGSLEFGYQGEYAAAGLTLSHDIGAASGRDGSVERSSGVLDLSYRFAEKVRAGVTTGYYRNIADAGDLALNDTDETTLNLSPSLQMGLTDYLRLDASYSYSQIDDNIIDKARERSVYLLKLRLDYPVME
jgi:hypothetical protein